MEEIDEKTLILMNPHYFLITYIWDVLNVNANRMKSLFRNIQKMFESRISAGAAEKLPGWEMLRAKTVAWSYDMEGHAQNCVERYCELADKKVEQISKVSSPCLDDHQFKKEELDLSKVCSQIVLKCLYLARICRSHK